MKKLLTYLGLFGLSLTLRGQNTTISIASSNSVAAKLPITNAVAIGNFSANAAHGNLKLVDDGTSVNIFGGFQSNTFAGGIGNIQIGGRTNFPHKMETSTDLRTTFGGYDSTNNMFVGNIIGSQHSKTGTNGSHAIISGGSYNFADNDYGGWYGGTINFVNSNALASVGIGGSQNIINSSAGYSGIFNSFGSSVSNLYSGVLFGDRAGAMATHSVLIGGTGSTNTAAGSIGISGQNRITITNGSDKFVASYNSYYLESTGNLGIGYTNKDNIPSKLTLIPGYAGDGIRMQRYFSTGINEFWSFSIQNAAATDSEQWFETSNPFASASLPWMEPSTYHLKLLNKFIIGPPTAVTNSYFSINSSGRLAVNLGIGESVNSTFTLRPVTATDGGIRILRAAAAGTADSTHGVLIQNSLATDSAFFGYGAGANTTFPWYGTNSLVIRHVDGFRIGHSPAGLTPDLYIDNSGNLGLGTTSFGSSATRTLALTNGVAPSTTVASSVQLFSADQAGRSGDAGLHIITGFNTLGTNTYSLGQELVTPAGRRVNRKAFGGSHSVQIYEHYVVMGGVGGTFTFPSAASAGNGHMIIVKSSTGINTTNVPTGADTIEGAANDILLGLAAATYIGDGTNNWEKISKYP